MGVRFVLQPNGRLAYFSDIVDDFTHTNLTKRQAIVVAREHVGRKEAEEKVERGLKDELPWKVGVYGNGTARMKEALQCIEIRHGKARRREVEAQFGIFRPSIITLDDADYEDPDPWAAIDEADFFLDDDVGDRR